MSGDEILWPGSCFHDLIGARMLPGFDSGLLRRVLPRLQNEIIYAKVNLRRLKPATDAQLQFVGLSQMAQCAMKTLPQPKGRAGRPSRIATVQIAKQLGFRTAEIARTLQMPRRTIRELAATTREPAIENALRMQVALFLANHPEQRLES